MLKRLLPFIQYSTCLGLLILASPSAFALSFEWETATDAGSFIEETIGGVQAKFYGSEHVLESAPGGVSGLSGNIIANSQYSVSVQIFFDKVIDIQSLRFFDYDGFDGGTFFFRPYDAEGQPMTGQNVSYYMPVAEVNDSVLVTLNWTGVSRMRVDMGADPNQFGFDEINFTVPNQAPELIWWGYENLSYSEGQGSLYLDKNTNSQVTDDEENYDGGEYLLKVKTNKVASEDLLSLDTSGVVSLSGTTAGSNVLVSGTIVGTLENNIAEGNDLIVNLNSNADNDSLQALAQAAIYENTDTVSPDTSNRTVRLKITDGEGDSSYQDTTVLVSLVDDAPVAANSSVNTDEETTYTFASDDFGYSDEEGDSMASITVDYSSFVGNGSLQYNGSNITADTVIATANIGLLTYVPDGETGETASFDFTVNDGNSDSDSSATMTINVTGINDDPSLTGLASDVTVVEDITSDLDLSSATFADVDSSSLTLSLSVGSGTLTASSGGGVTVSGSETASLTFSGSVADLNTYLDTASNIQYTSASNANGNDATTLNVSANDGDGSGDVPLGTVNIDITAINDPPIVQNEIPNQTVSEDSAFEFQFAANAFDDVDGDDLTYTSTQSDESPLPDWLTFTDETRTFGGTPTNDDVGGVTIKVTASDGNGGSVSDTFSITVNNTNDNPTDIALSSTSILENESSGTTVGTLSSTDPDEGDGATFSLVSGTGDTGNASFTIDGTSLKTAESFDYETQSSYSVRIRATDGAGGTYEEAFTISVTDVNEDHTAPLISVISTEVTSSGATITWTTDEAASSQVGYGLTTNYGTTTTEADTSPRVTSHSVTLSGLQACGLYHYEVISEDAAGNVTRSEDQTFTTTGCTSEASVRVTKETEVTTSAGGMAEFDDVGLDIEIPADFKTGGPSNVRLQAKQLEADEVLREKPVSGGLIKAGNQVFELDVFSGDDDSRIDTFDKPLRLTFDISGSVLVSPRIYVWDEAQEAWLDAELTCEAGSRYFKQSGNLLTVDVCHFSLFGAFGGEPPSPGGGSEVNDIIRVCQNGKCFNRYPTKFDEGYETYHTCRKTYDGGKCAAAWALAQGYELESDYLARSQSQDAQPKAASQVTLSSAPDQIFSDVSAAHAYGEAIEWMKENGWLEGYEDGMFRPEQAINRVELLKIVLEAAGKNLQAVCRRFFNYTDVDWRSWYGDYVQKASCESIVNGYPDGTFHPGDTINFVEAAKVVVNARDLPTREASEGEPWFGPYVEVLKNAGAIPGSISANDQPLTRGEMAYIVWKLRE